MRVVVPISGENLSFLSEFPAAWPKVFVCPEALRDSALGPSLARLAPGCTVVWVPPHGRGPASAVIAAVRADPRCLPDDDPVLVSCGGLDLRWDPDDFEAFTRGTACDAAVLCYAGFHPMHLRPTERTSCRVEGGRVLEIGVQSHPADDPARECTAPGSYFVRTGALLKRACEAAMGDGSRADRCESDACDWMVREGLDVRAHPIQCFLRLSTPEDLGEYEYWAKAFDGQAVVPGRSAASGLQILMPMAGRGSRFGEGTPKPFRPVLGRPMFRAALDHLPPAAHQVLVVRADMEDEARRLAPGAELVALPGVTEGQAITCAAGAHRLDPDLPVLVSNSDHGMVWDDDRWLALLAEAPDVVVWGQRGYPGTQRKPSAFAYIEPRPGTDRVGKVSVKAPLSENPREDLLLAGTFWFRRPSLLTDAVRELVARNLRVNGEFYLDSVAGICADRGLDVRVFEANGFLCWGTPEALAEFGWWHRWFTRFARSA